MERYTIRIVTHGACNLLCITAQVFLRILFGSMPNHSLRIQARWNNTGTYMYQRFADSKSAWIALFPYQQQYIKQSIIDLKFHNQLHYAVLCGALLYEALTDVLGDITPLYNFTDPILCVVPSHASTVRQRGYCVPELIAKEALSSGLDDWVEYRPSTLMKTNYTGRQAQSRNRAERLKKPRGSFVLSEPAVVRNRNVIILDDVYTTGATMQECTRLLRRAGVKRILQISIAR